MLGLSIIISRCCQIDLGFLIGKNFILIRNAAIYLVLPELSVVNLALCYLILIPSTSSFKPAIF